MAERDGEAWRRRFERERAARREAEALMEAKSSELYQANQRLEALTRTLEERVGNRTEELRKNERAFIELSHAFLDLGTDFYDNVNLLTRVCGELLEATCAHYYREDGQLNAHAEYGYLVNKATASTICDWWRSYCE